MEQENDVEKQQTFFEPEMLIRNIVLKVLKAQGIPNPSDDVIDSAIKEHLNQKVMQWKTSEKSYNSIYTRSLHNAIFGTRKTSHYARTALTKTNFTSANFRTTEILRHYKRVLFQI